MTPLYACTRGPGCMPHKLSVYHEVYLRFRVNVRMRRQFMKWSLQLIYTLRCNLGLTVKQLTVINLGKISLYVEVNTADIVTFAVKLTVPGLQFYR